VDEGKIATLVGANGAGKSTTLRAISGLIHPSRGEIRFRGKPIQGMKPHQIVRAGISHVPEGRIVFANLTVLENLEMGAHALRGRAEWKRNLAQIVELFPVLAERRAQLAGTLSGGEQQMLSIGRGLAASPRVLMLDEPSMGLAPTIADQIFERIEKIHRESKITILLVEQRVAEALESCDRGYVLESGRVVLEGVHDTLIRDERVKRAYLGM
jgi:branched-chain amino acid transport system ATP-binding protein